ncbi:MAG: AAA family ATPase [Verrucomicrobiales bacterium]|nr:AAA family ATPase [Verrucomicrobiales bacterium]
MATVIPDHLPSRATRGEVMLHEILQGLPDHWMVWWEPDLQGISPDFVVLAPELGILVIEDKFWRPGTIVEGDRQEIVIATADGTRKRCKHPARQGRDYCFRLIELIGAQRYGKRFLRNSGPHEGKLRFPIARLVTLSNITANHLSDPARPLSPLFDPATTVTRDQLDQWQALSKEALANAFRSFFAPFWSIPALNNEEIKALRMIINPQVDLTEQFRTDELLTSPRAIDDQQDVLRVFDQRQEKCAMNVGEGHRILFGVAGSGKTLILLTRARLLAQQNPDAKILLTCYNKALALWMARQLRDFPAVTVNTFHTWATRIGVPFKERSDSEYGEAVLQALEECQEDARCFDAVLVDEAQDFEPNWFTCLLRSMKDPEKGDLLIVADAAQGLYRRSRISWKALGIKAAGRSHSQRFDLDRNYRNSTEILTLAETFATRTEMRHGTEEDDSLRSVRIDSQSAYRGTGASPILFLHESWEGEADTVVTLIASLMQGRWNGGAMPPLQAEEIAILYPRASGADGRLIQETAKNQPSSPSRPIASTGQPSIASSQSARSSGVVGCL